MVADAAVEPFPIVLLAAIFDEHVSFRDGEHEFFGLGSSPPGVELPIPSDVEIKSLGGRGSNRVLQYVPQNGWIGFSLDCPCSLDASTKGDAVAKTDDASVGL